MSLAGGAVVGVEGLPGTGQGEAGVLEGLAQLAVAARQRFQASRRTSVSVGGQDPTVEVEGVRHDQSVGEQRPGGHAVGGVAVDGDDTHPGPLGVAVEGCEEQHRRGVPPRRHVDDDAALGVAEHRGVDEVLAHAALVDGEVGTQPPTPPLKGRSSPCPHGDAQVVLGHAQVTGHRPRRPPSGQVGEPFQCPVAGPAPADPLEALVESPLGEVLPPAHEAPHADGECDHTRAHDVHHVAPARAVGRSRRPQARRAQRDWMSAGDMHDRPGAGLVDRRERVHVAPAQAQGDTVTHGSGPPLQLFDKPKLGSQAHHRWWIPEAVGISSSQPSFAKTRIYAPATSGTMTNSRRSRHLVEGSQNSATA